MRCETKAVPSYDAKLKRKKNARKGGREVGKGGEEVHSFNTQQLGGYGGADEERGQAD